MEMDHRSCDVERKQLGFSWGHLDKLSHDRHGGTMLTTCAQMEGTGYKAKAKAMTC